MKASEFRDEVALKIVVPLMEKLFEPKVMIGPNNPHIDPYKELAIKLWDHVDAILIEREIKTS